MAACEKRPIQATRIDRLVDDIERELQETGEKEVDSSVIIDAVLSRLAALLASHDGCWYIHSLGKGPIGRNTRGVRGYAPAEDGDELVDLIREIRGVRHGTQHYIPLGSR